ncbi:MAG: hypothetical protein OXF95_01375 [Rhodobacteraceae bacterium]|nr:hypothetical protein [Paracoccaceae bacterium]
MWKARSIQVGWFVTNSSGVPVEKLFEALTDREPDSFMKNRVPNPQYPFLSNATGVSDTEINTINVEPGRVFWIIEPRIEVSDPPFPKLLEIEPTIEKIRNRILELDGGLLGETTRLTIISTLILTMNSIADVNRKLVNMCDINLNPEWLNELQIRVNRRKKIIRGIDINRIAKFSTVQSSLVMKNMQTGDEVLTNEKYAVQVQLDFNTVPTGKLYSVKQQQNIFQILCNETLFFVNNPHISSFS